MTDNAQYTYAVDTISGRTVHIDVVNRANKLSYTFCCPHCRKELIPVLGDYRVHHFRHVGEVCQYNNYLHSLAEKIFYEEYTACLENGKPFVLAANVPILCNKNCVLREHRDCSNHYVWREIDLTKFFTRISVEQSVRTDSGYRRPDILLESDDGLQLWVEIWVTHESAFDKRQEGRIVEIKIDDEQDLEMFRQHRIQPVFKGDVRFFNFIVGDKDLRQLLGDAPNGIHPPCEKFFSFRLTKEATEVQIVEKPEIPVTPDLIYSVVLQLNWNGNYQSFDDLPGKKFFLEDLKEFSWRRAASQKEVSGNKDEQLSLLVVQEWRPSSASPRKPFVRRNPIPDAPKVPQYMPPRILSIEWVDLGLPSGTLWAPEDLGQELNHLNASDRYAPYLPTVEQAEELVHYCDQIDYPMEKRIEFVGPSGKSVSFGFHDKYENYWLEGHPEGELIFGNCLKIVSGNSVYINDDDVQKPGRVRFVKKKG